MGKLKRSPRAGIIFYTVCICFGMWVLAGVHSAIGTFQSDMIDSFSLVESQKGLPSSMLSCFTILTFVAVMFLAGRARKISILITGLALGFVSLCLIQLLNVHSFTLLLVLLSAAGIACGAIDSLSSAVISELYPGKSGIMCVLHALYGLSGFSMPFLFKLFIKPKPWVNGSYEVGTWRAAFASLGACMLALFVMLIVLKRLYGDGIEEKPKKSERVRAAMVKQVLSEKRLWPLYLSSVLGGMYMNTMLVWTPRFISIGHGGEKYLSWALPCVYLSITLSRLTMSWIKPPLARTLKGMMPFAALLLAVAILVKSPLAALIFTFLSVFCYAPVIPFQVTLAGDVLPERRFIVTVSLMFVMMLGQTVIAPVIGLAESRWGINAALYLAAAAMALSWIAALFIKNDDRKA